MLHSRISTYRTDSELGTFPQEQPSYLSKKKPTTALAGPPILKGETHNSLSRRTKHFKIQAQTPTPRASHTFPRQKSVFLIPQRKREKKILMKRIRLGGRKYQGGLEATIPDSCSSLLSLWALGCASDLDGGLKKKRKEMGFQFFVGPGCFW